MELNMDDLVERLNELAQHMESCATDLSMYHDSLAHSEKADELYKCSGIIKEWAESIKADTE